MAGALPEPLEAHLGRLLEQHRLTLCTAESCTGGLVAHRITNISGSSAYFLGGIVSYSNAVKQSVLRVEPAVLEQYGAVSEPTARQMALGVRRLLGADLALAITGTAGPTGGTTEKPVGLVYVALAAHDVVRCERFLWSGDREENKRLSAEAALRMALSYLGAPAAEESAALAVCARFGPAGEVVPQSFCWLGEVRRICSVSRRWSQAGWLHFLVMDERQHVCELALNRQTLRWLLVPLPGSATGTERA